MKRMTFVIMLSALVGVSADSTAQTYYDDNSAIKGWGFGVNFAPVLFNGYGGVAWFNVDHLRFNLEYATNEIPSSFLRDNFEEGKIEKSVRFSIDYFFGGNLQGAYLPIGLETWEMSVGHKYTNARGTYDMVYLAIGVGYILRFTDYLYFDSRFSLGGSLSKPGEVDVGGYDFLPNEESYNIFIGLGLVF